MLIDPSQASKYWCPMSRVSDENITSINRFYHGLSGTGMVAPGGCFCLGEKCMAWRWKEEEKLGFCGLVGEA